MEAFRQQFQLPFNGSHLVSWPSVGGHGEKRKLEMETNEVAERLHDIALSPNSLKKVRTAEAEDVSTAPTILGSSLPQQQFDGAALEIELDSTHMGEERPFLVQLPSPSSPDGSPPRGGAQNAIILYQGNRGPIPPASQTPIGSTGGNSDLMQALDLKGRGGAEASAALDIPRRLVRNNSCSSLPRFFFQFPGDTSAASSSAADSEMEEDSDPNSKAVIPWAPPPFVLQGLLGAARSGGPQPMEEEMEDEGGMS